MLRLVIIFFLAVVTTGCSMRHQYQLTSGQSYLTKYNQDISDETSDLEVVTLDDRIKKAASIEPILNFPARIGIAKFENGNFVDISESDYNAWNIITENNIQLGQLVPINVLGTTGISRSNRAYNGYQYGNTVEEVRIAAAMQHLDAVLIYEVNAVSRDYNTPLAVVDLTIVGGAILPTRSIQVESNARALLIDVRNGYPYGTATAQLDVQKYSGSWGTNAREKRIKNETMANVFQKLIPEVDDMFAEVIAKRTH